MKYKKFIPIALAALLLAGCAGEPMSDAGIEDYVQTQELVLPDGRTVFCLVYQAGNRAGLSCDWENAI